MCGFTGFYAITSNYPRGDVHKLAQAMGDTLMHRGPDSGDVWQDPDIALALSHRRLAILDLSKHGHQPMASASDRYMIAFNGEIYNHLTLRATYLSDHRFRGHSDTETILALFEKLGFEKTLEVMNGMFAFALWDRKARMLHFARDRHGKKPLYVGWAGDSLLFGSELKAFHAHPDFKSKIDKKSLALYLQYNCVPAPHCIYKNIWQISPGHSLSLEVGGLKKDTDLRALMRPYWSAVEAMFAAKKDAAVDPVNDTDDISRRFEAVLSACVRDRLISDVPLGAFLSGGIDSSIVVALMQNISDTPVHTYTIGFEEAGFNEAAYAKETAQHLGTQHHEHICRAQDAMDIIPKLPAMYDEPFADQSAIPTFMVAQFARQDVTVALSGDGGDEMMGGYSRHITGPEIADFAARFPSAIRDGMASGLSAIPSSMLRTLFPRKPLLSKHLRKTAALMSAENDAEIYDILLRNWETPPVYRHMDAKLDLAALDGLSLAEKLMVWDSMHYLSDDILTKVDRASMAVSLEARAPLLDRRVYDFVWGLPMDVKIRGGKGKWLLRDVLKRHVPEHLFERPKQGFNIPIGDWLRGDLRDWAEDLLDEKTIEAQGLLNPYVVRKIWHAHLQRKTDYTSQLWNILMFQAWHKHWQ